jgi:hypothetical protein
MAASGNDVAEDGGMTSPAGRYAERLLTSLQLASTIESGHDPVTDWARSGAMALTGRADGPPQVVTGPAIALRGALMALQSLAPEPVLLGMGLLGERAALTRSHRQGNTSCSGASKLLATADGTIALTLARESDVELLPALVEAEIDLPWQAVAAWLAARTSAEAIERLTLLGLPFGVAGEASADLPWLMAEIGSRQPTRGRPVVVNLGALWAAPLAASLLGMLGCRVLKVEDVRRPDGARRGSADFFRLLNDGAEEIFLDFSTEAGRVTLRQLLVTADVVLEASRPRALAQLGLSAGDVLLEADGLTWISITGQGRDLDRVGFGDDAAVAGGLVSSGCFVGDAIADPLTGVHAALAAWAGILGGGALLVDLALSRVAAAARALDTGDPREAYLDKHSWYVDSPDGPVAVAQPSLR